MTDAMEAGSEANRRFKAPHHNGAVDRGGEQVGMVRAPATGTYEDRDSLKAVEAYGFRVNVATIDEYVDLIHATIAHKERRTIYSHNLHSLYLYFREPDLPALYEGAVVRIDGMPIVWMMGAGRGWPRRCHRVAWIDLLWPVMQKAEREGWKIFYLGSRREVMRSALSRIRERVPGLMIEGHHGYFDATPGSGDNARIVQRINDYGADLCLVGMGMPRQERWVAAHRAELNVPVVLTCGACMEFVADAAGTPPRWLGPLGLEWSYRLLGNPRRFAHRCLVEPWLLLGLMARQNLWQHPMGATRAIVRRRSET